jgi:sulfate permease, SulP family
MPGQSKLKQFIPLLDWIQSYSKEHFKGDLNAGLTVGIMLIPQGMAYAVLAGLPPVYGLYASIVPLVLYGIFGSSRQLAVGPVAIISLLVIAGVSELAAVGSDRFIQLAILTAFGVGLFQLLMGFLKMGFLVNFLSHPVLSGFTSAVALIIAASQIRSLLGINLPHTNQVHEILIGVVQKIGEIEPVTAVIGLGSIAAIISIKIWSQRFPSALLVVIAGILITALWGLEARGVSIVGDIPRGLPSFEMANINFGDLQMLFPLILVISLVGYMESIAVAKVIATRRGYKIDADQELVALGAANIGGSLFQSFPVTGGFSRSAVNDQSGARTGMASIISAGIIALTVLLLTPLFYYLPSTVLAAIIIVAVIGLFDSKEIINLWKTDRKDLAMLLVTFIATLTLGIEEGIAVGVIISLVAVIYSSTTPHSAELGRLGKTQNFRNVNRYPEADVDEDVLIFRFDSQLYFANVEYFRETLEGLLEKKGEKLNLVILDASAMTNIDSTGIHTMKELVQDLGVRRIRFYIAGAIGPVRDKLKKSGISDAMGEENFFFDISDALAFYRQHGEEQRKQEFSPFQTNI